MRITESQLRKIVREEASRLRPRRLVEGNFSYARKLEMLQAAHDALLDAQGYEAGSDIGGDPELDEIVAALAAYIEAVEALAVDEDVPMEHPASAPMPRSMRH